MTKYIVVIGGVISGVGKGVASASIAKIMQEYGFKTTAVKIDPYINCDAGTLRPTEHGEVWVTDDGGETDQDLGTYERFLGFPILKLNNITTGQIYRNLIAKERRGDFLGETVQFIPHVPGEIKKRVLDAGKDYEVCIVEIGGTIGDYENVPFLFAMRALERELGRNNLIYVLVTYLPVPSHIDEMKTKPTQIAIKLLRENAIQPDIVLCRGKTALDAPRKKKIEIYANVSSDEVISMPDVDTAEKKGSIYRIPLDLESERIGEKILEKFHMTKKSEPDWSEWKVLVERMINPEKKVKVGIIGKYLDIGAYNLTDSYLSINEAIRHAGAKNNVGVELVWIDSKKLEQQPPEELLADLKGIIVPGGFGESGVEGKIKAVKYARENNIPYLGLCYGLQMAVIEFARNVCGLNAHTTEVAPEIEHKVIDILPEQKVISEKGATMRLGAYTAKLSGRVREIYGKDEVSERHRHRYEVNPEYHSILQEKGLVLSGMSPDMRLVEFIELPNHKFFIATQAHPEFNSSLLKPAPLFDAFVKSMMQ
ncbi:MAG: CTP synthase [archaeon]